MWRRPDRGQSYCDCQGRIQGQVEDVLFKKPAKFVVKKVLIWVVLTLGPPIALYSLAILVALVVIGTVAAGVSALFSWLGF